MRVLVCGAGAIGAATAYFLSRRGAEVIVIERTGVFYNPLSDTWNRSRDMDVNYMVLAQKPE